MREGEKGEVFVGSRNHLGVFVCAYELSVQVTAVGTAISGLPGVVPKPMHWTGKENMARIILQDMEDYSNNVMSILRTPHQ